MRRGAFTLLLLLLLLPSSSLLLCADAAALSAEQREEWRRAVVDQFLDERRAMEPLCLYTFDEPLDDVRQSLDVADTQVAHIRGHLPEKCPFGDLHADPALVSSLNTNKSFFQLGVHLDPDPDNDPLRVQMASAEVVSAREFFVQHATTTDSRVGSNPFVQLMARYMSVLGKKVRSNGVSFEMTLRRRAKRNQTMSLFGILNGLDACTDAGFRLDVTVNQTLRFTYSLPVSTDEGPTCLMQSFSSHLPGDATCTLPPMEDLPENTPPVYIMVAFSPSEELRKWNGAYYLSYIDATTHERVDCNVKHEMELPEDVMLDDEDIEGSYRLYLGNHPRNLSSPRPRLYSPKAREFRQYGGEWDNENATTRLREALRTKLMQLRGPEMPNAMRILKPGRSYAINIGKFTFPPISEDTPFAAIREQIEIVKMKHGDAIIEHLMDSLKKMVDKDEEKKASAKNSQPSLLGRPSGSTGMQQSKEDGGQASEDASTFMQTNGEEATTDEDEEKTDSTEDSKPSLTSKLSGFLGMGKREEKAQKREALVKLMKTNEEGATFDIFHFAIYDNVPTDKRFRRLLWNNKEQPFRASPFHHFPAPEYKQTIEEDEEKLLSLTQLHSVFNDVRLELLSLPETGKLLLFPNKSHLREDNRAAFSRLPLEYQRLVYYVPDADSNNGKPWSGSFKAEPYGTIRYRIMESVASRKVDAKQRNASLDVFVDEKNDPPKPRVPVLNISVTPNIPITLVLDGDDPDGVKLQDTLSEKAIDAKDASLLDKSLSVLAGFVQAKNPLAQPQILQISQFPRFGTLFDISLCDWQTAYKISDATALQDCQIEASPNATFPTNLVYVYRGWGRETSTAPDAKPLRNNSDGSPLDWMEYRLSDGDKSVFSDMATINFFAASVQNKSEKAFGSTSTEMKTAKIVNISEDSLAVITLAEVEPLGGALSPKTRYELTTLPAHGSLFQYIDSRLLGSDDRSTANSSLVNGVFVLQDAYAVGSRISSPRQLVVDPLGRLIYVPERNYFNAEANTPYRGETLPLDSLEYKVLGVARSDNFSLDAFAGHDESAIELADPRHVRAVKMRVVSQPDPIAILPPYVVKTSMDQGEAVPVPLSFEDPDGSFKDGRYDVVLEADKKAIVIELPQQIGENDAIAECDYDRPCFLERNISGSKPPHHMNDSVLTYIVDDYLPFTHIVHVSGTYEAMRSALSGLVVRDTDKFGWEKAHTVLFTFTIKRANVTANRRASETIRVAFAARKPKPKMRGIIRRLTRRITQWLWTGGFIALFVIVTQNLPCCATGFCCCLRSKARRKQRKRFEEKRREFQDRVAQNDYEYSLLIVELADVILQPDLLVAISLLRSTEPGRAPTRCRLEQVLCLNSVLPVLESERQGTRFVFALVLLEFQQASEEVGFTVQAFDERSFLEYPSVASLALSVFCRMLGSRWLSDTLEQPPTASENTRAVDALDVADEVLDQFAARATDLPVEIVILCRAVSKLLGSDETLDSRAKAQSQLAATHLVFFGHFVGPALMLAEAKRLSSHVKGCDDGRDQALAALALALSRLPERWTSRHCARDTECALHATAMTGSAGSAVSHSSSSSDSFERSSAGRDSTPFDRVEEIARHCCLRYEALLRMIAVSDQVESSYTPPTTGYADNELMALCLMNVHTYLDTHLGVFREQFRVFVTRRMCASGLPPGTVESLTEEETQDTEVRVVRVMRALGFPMMSMHALVEHSKGEILSDALVWSGLSLREWTERSHGLIRGVGEALGARRGRRRRVQRSGGGGGRCEEEPPAERGTLRRRAFSHAHSLDSVHVEKQHRQQDEHHGERQSDDAMVFL